MKKGVDWNVEAIDDSFDLLYDLQKEHGYCTGTEMWREIETGCLFLSPRELIIKFPTIVQNAERH